MKQQSILSVLGLLIAFIGMVFWFDSATLQEERQVLGEHIVKSDVVKNNNFSTGTNVYGYDEAISSNATDSIATSGNSMKDANHAPIVQVVKVVDGDTIDINMNGKIERIRLIGIDAPESVDPRKDVECFGLDASAKLKELLISGTVYVAADKTQSDRDIYGRLLRYVWNEDNMFINENMIKEGYAREYTYKNPYKYQKDFQMMQRYAQELKLGLWSDNACLNQNSQQLQTNDIVLDLENEVCAIKGNINTKNNKKIYHTTDCPSYAQTKIDLSKGERYFCSEEEAVSAGWRKADNCP